MFNTAHISYLQPVAFHLYLNRYIVKMILLFSRLTLMMDQSKQLFVYCIIIIIPVYLSQVDIRCQRSRGEEDKFNEASLECLRNPGFLLICNWRSSSYDFQCQGCDRAEANSEANQWRIFLCRSHSLDVFREPFKDYIDSEGVRLTFLTIFE